MHWRALDYELLAGVLDWGGLLTRVAAGGKPLRLLDVACGSGKVPEARVRQPASTGLTR